MLRRLRAHPGENRRVEVQAVHHDIRLDAPTPKGKTFDGLDIAPLLLQDPTDANLVRDGDGNVRDTMVWHFPNSSAQESSIRIGDYKLVRNYGHVGVQHTDELELYSLYETVDGEQKRVDIEESNNLAASMPEKARELNQKLTQILEGMQASYPHYNPGFAGKLANKAKVA